MALNATRFDIFIKHKKIYQKNISFFFETLWQIKK